jgi:type 1 glutamine amidotransferase
VETVLKGAAAKPPTDRRLHIVLCSGPKDHGPGEHDYPLWRRRWVKLFDLADNVFVSEAEGWPSKEQLADAHLIAFYSNNPGWSAARAAELDTFLQRGGGLVYMHYAVDGHNAVGELAQHIGLAWQGGRSKFRHGPLDLAFPNPQHPITRGFEKLKVHFEDESYWDLAGDPKRIDVLATGVEDGAAQPLFWAREAGKGRVFVSILGHYTWTFDDPLFRVLMLRGMAWSAGESVDRFNPLVYPGAGVAP